MCSGNLSKESPPAVILNQLGLSQELHITCSQEKKKLRKINSWQESLPPITINRCELWEAQEGNKWHGAAFSSFLSKGSVHFLNNCKRRCKFMHISRIHLPLDFRQRYSGNYNSGEIV